MKGIRKLTSLTGAFALVLALLSGFHSQGFAAEKKFDHDNTGFILNGAHQKAACDSCHIRGIFKGIPKTCESCHATVTQMTATKKPANHMNTTNRCDDCHLESGWKPAQTDHAAVKGTCESCHTPAAHIATSKPSNHMPSDNRCDACHRTSTWQTSAGRPDHTTLTNCTQCHVSGGAATTFKRTPPHIATSNNCESCHNKTAARWTPVTRVDHNEITSVNPCAACHESRRPAGHYPGDCGSSGCHTSTTSWAMGAASGVKPDHTTVTNCIQCHISGGRATTYKSATHINTSNNCEACHSKTAAAWKPVTRVDHNEITNLTPCATCHEAKRPVPHFPGDCSSSGCHTSTVTWVMTAGVKPDHSTLTNCINCHVSGGQAKTYKTASHINTSTNCEACHSKSAAAWKPVTRVDHNEVIGTCVSCHASKRPAPPHDQTQNCNTSNCHNSTTTWVTNAKPDHATYTNCTMCHISGGFAKTSKVSPPHIDTTNNCEACHSKSAVAWKPVTRVDHNEIPGAETKCTSCHEKDRPIRATHASTGNCFGSGCHTSTTTWMTAGGKPPDHNTRTSGCSTCHGVTATGKPTNHIPSETLCENCHNPTGWRPHKFTHSMTTLACTACHTAAIRPVNMTGHIQIISNPDCGACHNTGVAGSGWTSIKRVDHTQIPTTVTCVTCHVSGGKAKTFKSNTHSNTSNNCAACHSSSGAHFTPFTRFDHRETTATCASCHNVGMRYTRWPTNHFPTSRACNDSCHNTSVWGPGTNFDHVGYAAGSGNCISCHSNNYGVQLYVNVPPKSSNHFITTAQCDQCHHITTAWTPVKYTHMSPNAPSGANNEHTGLTCRRCHTANTQSVSYSASAYIGFCAACHASKFNDALSKHNSRGIYLTATNDNGKDCSRCHSYRGGW